MSARGRIFLLKAVEQGRLKLNSALSQKIFSCLTCGACLKRCSPSVPIHDLFFHARQRLTDESVKIKTLQTLLTLSLSNPESSAFFYRALQKFSLAKTFKCDWFEGLPLASENAPFLKQSRLINAQPSKAVKVLIFVGCVINYLYPRQAEALMSALNRLGYEAAFLQGEVCCGAPLKTVGLRDEAAEFAKKNLALFNVHNSDTILTLCPTCATTIRFDYPEITGAPLNKTVLDINQFFVNHEIPLNAPQTSKVAYHDPCHLKNMLNVQQQPSDLLRSIKGVELVEIQDTIECCGFGGLFSVAFRELSEQIGRKKIESLQRSHIETLVTACPGCVLQFERMAAINRTPLKVKHIIEVIAESMTPETQER
jgi:glycolate oxidase iron-sulfur subunit